MHTKETLERFVTDIPTQNPGPASRWTSHRHRRAPFTMPNVVDLPQKLIIAARRFVCRCFEPRGVDLSSRVAWFLENDILSRRAALEGILAGLSSNNHPTRELSLAATLLPAWPQLNPPRISDCPSSHSHPTRKSP